MSLMSAGLPCRSLKYMYPGNKFYFSTLYLDEMFIKRPCLWPGRFLFYKTNLFDEIVYNI
ncbi:Uncharacterized protein dnl_57840 [Desulfonema limicola]|uniref:Uncharacterized protein n=1 Tax=Desulfonema limicola TaxID=45656 RepID=A0A975BE14_9BACT|nr:Uncharacterized protein dnl_57840 [Desulfonema limicola]